MNGLWAWFLHVTGASNESGTWYGFWSGFGSDIGEVVIFGAIVGAYRRHNCHVRRCWRIAREQVAGTTWVVCRRHHHSDAPTAADVLAARQADTPGDPIKP